MRAHFLKNSPEIHTTPLHKILIDECNSIIEFDDINEKRWIVDIKTIQAWKITDINCFDMSSIINDSLLDNGRLIRHPLIVEDSEWLINLKKVLEYNNQHVNYYQNTLHFLFVLGDDVVEIIAGDNLKIVEK